MHYHCTDRSNFCLANLQLQSLTHALSIHSLYLAVFINVPYLNIMKFSFCIGVVLQCFIPIIVLYRNIMSEFFYSELLKICLLHKYMYNDNLCPMIHQSQLSQIGICFSWNEKQCRFFFYLNSRDTYRYSSL